MTKIIQLVGALLGTFFGFGLGLLILDRAPDVVSEPNRPAFLMAVVAASLLFGYLAIPYITVYPFRWVRSPSNSVAAGTNVATTMGYTPVAGDMGNFLFFCVTPVAATGATPGLEVCSPASQIGFASPIPTLSQWGMIILSILMGCFTTAFARRRR